MAGMLTANFRTAAQATIFLISIFAGLYRLMVGLAAHAFNRPLGIQEPLRQVMGAPKAGQAVKMDEIASVWL